MIQDQDVLFAKHVGRDRRAELRSHVIDLLSCDERINQLVNDIASVELGAPYREARNNNTLDDYSPYWDLVASLHEQLLVNTALFSARFVNTETEEAVAA